MPAGSRWRGCLWRAGVAAAWVAALGGAPAAAQSTGDAEDDCAHAASFMERRELLGVQLVRPSGADAEIRAKAREGLWRQLFWRERHLTRCGARLAPLVEAALARRGPDREEVAALFERLIGQQMETSDHLRFLAALFAISSRGEVETASLSLAADELAERATVLAHEAEAVDEVLRRIGRGEDPGASPVLSGRQMKAFLPTDWRP